MDKTQLPANFIKHTSKNPIQKFLINNFYSTLISLVRPLLPKTVLDAGCGEGFTLNKLMSNQIGQIIEGVEYTKEAITLGKKLFPKAKIEQGSIYSLPYKNNSFDLVLCNEVLEHLENPQKALLEIVRVSKKYAILSVPNEPIFRLSNLLAGKYVLGFGNSPGHINHWSPLSLINFVKKSGLRILKTKFPFPWIIVLAEKQ
jgi:2-polyprenyl-3-methyl-5-hydroxy-6-metoxy-1,4-benzoquinol methylase